MNPMDLACRVKERRKKLFANPDWNGIDFLDVAEDQLSLCVHFFGQVPEDITVANVRIAGGRRIRGIEATKVEIDRSHDPEVDDCLRITLDKFGDFSTYRLCLVERLDAIASPAAAVGPDECSCERSARPLSGLDPRYACIDFSFKVDCPSDLDCRAQPECPPPVYLAPEINYLAKDYASFRQLIFDRLALTMPDWRERHVPDIGVTLVELLAYVGDYLSYYQDAVGTEAYLDTARQRISVRRHARLVDYRMHEGCNARAWVSVWTQTDLPPIPATEFYFSTGFSGIKTTGGNVVKAADLQGVPPSSYDIFEPRLIATEENIQFFAAHSEIHLYTWGDEECCLPQGATRATLWDEAPDASPTHPSSDPAGYAYAMDKGATAAPQRALELKEGDVLIFEEVLGATTENPADADPAHRHAVRLTRVSESEDKLLKHLVLEIEWGPEDALPFSLCLSARLPAPDCRWIHDVSVARGNVVLVDHGRHVREPEPLGPVAEQDLIGECACDGSVINETTAPARFRPRLTQGPLTFAEPLPPKVSASAAARQNPRRALPELWLREYVDQESTATGPSWTTAYDLLESASGDRHLVVEMDDDARAHLRFGDGELGMQPAAGTRFHAAYRIGNGPAGNVGRETINYLVLRSGSLDAGSVKPRNPLPAQGGTAPEPSAEVKLFAPHAFRNRRERAITSEDYAELAMRNPKIQRAAAALRWMGSWYEARVAIDPAHTQEADPALLAEIDAYLFKYRRMGHDLAVVPARYVPLHIVMQVCVLPHFARGQVKAELLRVLGRQRLSDGAQGFFHPDNLSFGEGVHLSRIIAVATSIEGVETVDVTTLKRLHEPLPHALKSTRRKSDGTMQTFDVPNTGILSVGWMEIAQLDNDPSFPENGELEFILGGGR